MLYVWCLAMASILGKPGGPGQFPTHDLSTVRGALQDVGREEVYREPSRSTEKSRQPCRRTPKVQASPGTRVSNICQGTRLGSSANTGCRERRSLPRALVAKSSHSF